MKATLLLLAGGLLLLALLWLLLRGSGRRRHAREALMRRIVGETEPATAQPRPVRRGSGMAMPRFLRLLLARATLHPTRESVAMAASALCFAVVLAVWSGGPLLGLAVLFGILSVAFVALRLLAERRVNAFVGELPVFLDALRQLLVIGNSFQQALSKATLNAGPAVQRYFRPVLRRVNNGAPVPDSIFWAAQRLDVAELHVLATAVETNFRYGGRMSVVLSNLIEVLRNRARVGRELRSATSETRTAMKVIVVLPMLVAVMVGLATPSYVTYFTASETGPWVGLGAVGLQLTGFLVMRRIMRMDF